MSAAGAHLSLAKVTAAPLAGLPMYDLPELQGANDLLWSAIAQRLRAAGVRNVPTALDRNVSLESLWTDPELLLSQTCGYPFIKGLKGQVRLVSTPRYKARGCDGPFYRSAVVVRLSDPAANLIDLRAQRCAVNDWASNSGMNLLRAELAAVADRSAFFSGVLLTGSHLASAEAVAEGLADIAAIDAVTWAHIGRLRPALASRLRVLMWTMKSPGLPLITSGRTSEDVHTALIGALNDVARDPALKAVRSELLLDGFSVLPPVYYRMISYIETLAIDQGYPELR